MVRQEYYEIFNKAKNINDYVKKVWEKEPDKNVSTIVRDYHRILTKKIEKEEQKKDINVSMFENIIIQKGVKDLYELGKLSKTNIIKYFNPPTKQIQDFFNQNPEVKKYEI